MDKFPSATEPKRKLSVKTKFTTNAITEEDEEEEDDAPMTGADLLNLIQGRMNVQPTKLSRHQTFQKPSSLKPSRVQSPPTSPAVNGNNKENDSVRFKFDSVKPEVIEKGRSDSLRSSKNNSPFSIEDENYGYISNKATNLETALALSLNRRIAKSNALPPTCFKHVDFTLNEDLDDPYPTEEVETETRIYLSSRVFMMYFAQQFADLAAKIHMEQLVNGAKLLDPRIICHQERSNSGDFNFAKEDSTDFIPSIDVGFWPDEGIEWYLRRRRKVRDKRTDTKYQFPSPELVSQAQQIGCNLVPVGFKVPKRRKSQLNTDSEMNIQWEYRFIKAEYFMQKSLNHPKIRCLLFAILIFKTFLSDASSVTPRHIR